MQLVLLLQQQLLLLLLGVHMSTGQRLLSEILASMKRPAAAEAKAKPQSSTKADTKDVAADDQLDQPVQPEEPSPKKIELFRQN